MRFRRRRGHRLVSTERTPRVRGASLAPGDLDSDEWAEDAIRDRLPRLRTMATEWQKTVGTVAGLLGIGALFNADAAVRVLGEISRIAFAVLAVCAFLAASGSIVLASLASQSRVLQVTPDVRSRRDLQESAFTYTRDRLKWSRQLAGVAVVALLGSFLVRWFG